MVKKKEVKVVKKVEVKADPVVEERAVVSNVTVHLDRRDSGTNHLKSEALPSLDD